MSILLKNIQGADSVLPGKEKRPHKKGNAYPSGFNDCRASLETVSLEFDVQKMAEILHLPNSHVPWAFLSEESKKMYRYRSQKLIDNFNLFARLDKSK